MSPLVSQTPEAGALAFRRLITRPGALRWFLLRRLPLAWLAGIRLRTLTAEEASVTIRHRWLNQNPFRSLYFGAQAMAAELSSGLLVMQHVWQQRPGVSMLVTGMQAEFTRKATGLITSPARTAPPCAPPSRPPLPPAKARPWTPPASAATRAAPKWRASRFGGP